MKEFYENLKKKRKDKGISLEDIHQRTRLSLEYLKAIEAGEVEKLPAGYERIYLKRYAKEIGLDEEEVLRDFDLMTGRLKQPEPAAAKESPPKKTKKEEKEKKEIEPDSIPQISSPEIRKKIDNLNLDRIHKIFWISLAGVILAVAAYFTYRQYVVQQESQNLAIREITISELMESVEPREEQTPSDTAASANDELPAANLTPQLLLELRARERTWIREIVDSRDTSDYILPAGLNHSSEAIQQFQLLLGRADGVEIWLNGNNLGVMGQIGEIAYVVLNADGVALKRVRRVTDPSAAPTNGDTTVTEEAGPDSL